jgi:hypothetical protein
MMKMLRRMGIAVGCVLIVLVAVVLAGYYLFFRAPPAANFPAAHTSAEANQQDLAYLRHLPARDRSFTSTTAAAFYRAMDALKDRAGGLDHLRNPHRPSDSYQVARAMVNIYLNLSAIHRKFA